ncbi:MAG: hypothetical protein KDJ14_15075, partial [Xanthomonadales bacterium]|nr:hypothetical protein [Xanthomonadales bacterium]
MTSEPQPATCHPALRRLRAAFLALAATALFWSPLHAADVLVNSGADSLGNDGACTLREALENNDANAQIWSDCAGDFGPDSIRIQAGLGPIILGARLELTRPAEILGPPGGQVIQPAPGNREQLLWITPVVDGHFLVENLTFEGARHSQPGFSAGCANKGGAVCVHSLFADVDIVLRKITFRDNRVTNLVPANITGGGALFVNVGGDSTVRVEESLFQNNRLQDDDHDASEGFGGAVLTLSPLTLSRSLLVNNLMDPLLLGQGAVIYAFGGDLTVSQSTFSANGGAISGAAITARLSNLLILDSLFDGHSTGAEVVDFRTGSGATRYLTISNTQFADNQ